MHSSESLGSRQINTGNKQKVNSGTIRQGKLVLCENPFNDGKPAHGRLRRKAGITVSLADLLPSKLT